MVNFLQSLVASKHNEQFSTYQKSQLIEMSKLQNKYRVPVFSELW